MFFSLAECRCDADEKMGNFFCSDIKRNIQNLCEIDLIETVHDKKIMLIQKAKEEAEKRQKKLLQKRREEEKRKAEKRREEELHQRRREEEMKLKIEQDCLAQISLGHTMEMSLPGVDILRVENKNERDLIEIKNMKFEEVECEEIIARNHHVPNVPDNTLDGSYNEKSDADLHLEQVIDHDEDYENEDPDDEDDIENEITDEEIIDKEKEAVGEYEEISSGSPRLNSYFILTPTYGSTEKQHFMFNLFQSPNLNLFYVYFSVIFILCRSMSFTNSYYFCNGMYKFYL